MSPISTSAFGAVSGVGRLGWLAGGVSLLTLAFIAYRSAPLYNATGVRSVKAEGEETVRTQVATYSKSVQRDVEHVDGRSLFFIPSPPPPPPPPPPVHVDEKPRDLGPTPPTPLPSSYGGPKIIGAVGDYVWFDNGKRLKAGGEADGEIQVIFVTQIPWSARIAWKGVEFDVPFISRDGVVIKDENASTVSPPPEPPPPTPEPKKDEPKKDESKPDDKKPDEKKDDKKPDEKKPEEKKEGGATPAPPPPAPPPVK